VDRAADCGSFEHYPCTWRTIPGTGRGIAYVTHQSRTYADSDERFYSGSAVARRGDVLMHIDINSPHRVDISLLLDLAKRQWEKL
jgi:hypothetical protein